MKKLILPLAAVALISCDSNTYEDIEQEIIIDGPVTYNANVKAIIDANCVMCHNSAGQASFRPLTTYAEVKAAVEQAGLLNRIQLQNGQPGIMPSTGRMPQSTIDVILEWSTDGLLETE
ncbi:hypothetical protein AM493_12415 [Flavobacterium akiainvivens]|uniref:Cytochrome c domain-containing protein n=1 Tax=Flavobacterium akiainvivens TaxID=1202724 RepID=A0A0M9VK03_9FLAO|nr:hypothetical protein [Flavobacterium akiainvivens]KOS08339.1 hypothetical protein AM493_12415 [Flavobacterium akiainvivens]SFQ74448.1 hypothetical protein SAMN05444144_12026 [Flavobacterium akiainvivens]